MANLRLAVSSLEVKDVFMHIFFCGFVEDPLRFNLNGHDTSYQFRLTIGQRKTLQNSMGGRDMVYGQIIKWLSLV